MDEEDGKPAITADVCVTPTGAGYNAIVVFDLEQFFNEVVFLSFDGTDLDFGQIESLTEQMCASGFPASIMAAAPAGAW